jgi:hypothetical protein
LRLCRPTPRIHYWGLQHTPARTYCSPFSCMRSKSQLRLLVKLLTISSSFIILLIDEQLRLSCGLLVILLTTSSSFIILLINEQLQLPCRLLVLYCSRLAVLVLYCSSLSSCDFHVDLYYYTAQQFILYCSLVSSCDFHVDLYSGILATPIILWDLAAGKAA